LALLFVAGVFYHLVVGVRYEARVFTRPDAELGRTRERRLSCPRAQGPRDDPLRRYAYVLSDTQQRAAERIDKYRFWYPLGSTIEDRLLVGRYRVGIEPDPMCHDEA
jgi:hypothetical protein